MARCGNYVIPSGPFCQREGRQLIQTIQLEPCVIVELADDKGIAGDTRSADINVTKQGYLAVAGALILLSNLPAASEERCSHRVFTLPPSVVLLHKTPKDEPIPSSHSTGKALSLPTLMTHSMIHVLPRPPLHRLQL